MVDLVVKKKRKKRRGESIHGYFRNVFNENPDWIEIKSNDAVLARFQADHPRKKINNRIKQNLANVKSLLRRDIREGKREGVKADPFNLGGMTQFSSAGHGLERLEDYIDECLAMAKNMDRTEMEDVIKLLRRARNDVVLMQG